MNIKVNGRFQSQRVTGVQRYAREVTARLEGLSGFVTPRRRLRAWQGHLWEQGVLPAKLGGSLLFSPCNTGPLSVRRQVVTIHDCAFFDQAASFSGPFGMWYRWLIPRLARRVRKIITVSAFSRDRLLAWSGVGESQVAVIPNGVDPRFQRQDPERVEQLRQRLNLPPRYVLCVGSLEPRKNLRRLLQAWQRLEGRRGDAGLVVAGATGHVFKDAGFADAPAGVLLPGYVDDADLPTLYAGAEVFVYPSLYEGFGLTVLESMACGTPVVCSSTTSLPEVAGDAAVLVDPEDTDAIADGIARLLEDGALRDRLRAAGHERVKQFSWDRTAQMTADVLAAAAN